MKNKKTITIISLFILLTLSVAPVFSQGTIVDIAVDDPDNFSTLVAALTAADLVDTLNSEGPFTVFAPTNAAFDALPDGVLDYLLANT
ncbi:MAG: fasciclin domain-containing protein, partial [Candidatus Bathyarchaeota archaeon]